MRINRLFFSVLLGIWLLGAQLAFGFSQPSELNGEWLDMGPRPFIIETRGVEVIIKRPMRTADGHSFYREYRGQFRPGGFPVVSYAASGREITGSAPPAVMDQVAQRRHPFEGFVEFTGPSSIRFVTKWYNFRYDKGSNTLKAIEPSEEIVEQNLSRRNGYTIGNIGVDERPLRDRIQQRTQQVSQQIQDLEGQSEQLQSQLKQLLQNEQTQLQSIESLQQERTTLLGELSRLQEQVNQYNSQRSPEYTQLEQQKASVENTLRSIRQVREDYIRQGNAQGLGELDRQIAQKTQELADIAARMNQAFPNQAAVEQLNEQIKSKIRQRTDLEKRIAQASSQHDSQLSRITDLLNQQARNQKAVEEKKLLLAYLRQEPIIERITLQAGDDTRFEAFLAGDDDIKQLNEEIDGQVAEIDSLLQENVQQMSNAQEDLNQITPVREGYKSEFNLAAQEMNAVGDEIAELIWTNAKWRYGFELAGQLVDVALAAKDGGWAGVAAEVASKAAEAALLYATDNTAFSAFDESELQDAFQNNLAALNGQHEAENQAAPTLENPQTLSASDVETLEENLDKGLGAATSTGTALKNGVYNFLEEQGMKAPITILKPGFFRLYERRGLEKQIADAMASTAAPRPALPSLPGPNPAKLPAPKVNLAGSSGGPQIWVRHMQEIHAIKNAEDQVLQQLSRNGTQINEALSRRDSRTFRRLFAEHNQITDHLAKLRKQYVESGMTMRREYKRLADAKKKIEDMEKLSKANFKKLGADIGAGLAVDALVAVGGAWLDSQERALWNDFFQKQFVFQLKRIALQDASRVFYQMEDRVKALEETELALKGLRAQMIDYKTQINAGRKAHGFTIVKNEQFYTNDALSMQMDVYGPMLEERVFLLGEQPQIRVEARQVEQPVAPMTMQDMQRPIELNKTHRFTVNSQELPQLKRSGSLPLNIVKL